MQLSRGESVTLCGCRAHRFIMDSSTTSQTKDDICLLINSRSLLSDDGGKVFATANLLADVANHLHAKLNYSLK